MAKTATTRVGVVLDQQRGEHRHVGVVRLPRQPVGQDASQDDVEEGCRGVIRPARVWLCLVTAPSPAGGITAGIFR
jgi:hypothetical protein